MLRKKGLSIFLFIFVFAMVLGSYAEAETKFKFKMPKVKKGHDFTKTAYDAEYHEGQILVRFAPNGNGKMPSKDEKKNVLKKYGKGKLKHEYNIAAGLTIVELEDGQTVEQALETFNGKAEILYAEPDYEISLASTIPDDTRFDELWGMSKIDATKAWDVSTGSKDVVVAVLDTGIDYNHVDLADNMWVNVNEIVDGNDTDGNGYIDDIYGWDFADGDSDPMDYHYHGTHCAGTIGGVGNNAEGVVGVNWEVSIMSVKIFPNYGETGFVSGAIAAIEYSVANDADIMSNSWGGGPYDQGLKDAIDDAGEAGVLFVAAAGNNSNDSDAMPFYPSSFDLDNVISVLSTDSSDNKSGFSNYGSASVDIGAPGSSILSCEPGNKYQYLNGTSMAAPHVAGACALILSKFPDIPYADMKDLLLSTADPLDSLSGKCVSEGRLNVSAAMYSVIPAYNETQHAWYDTIGEAIADAADLDTIVVSPGTYNENINFGGKAITLTSSDPDDWDVVASTVIYGDGTTSTVVIDGGVGSNAILTGFTLTGGSAGVRTDGGASPVITNCIMEGNVSHGVHTKGGSSPTVKNNIIRSNPVGITCKAGAATFINNMIYGNGGGISISEEVNTAQIVNNTIAYNDGEGIAKSGPKNKIPAPTITNCILWGNTGEDLDDLFAATYSCIEDGDSGTGNISADPLFVDAANGDYNLMPASPCADAGDTSGDYTGQTDIDGQDRVMGNIVDIGADEVKGGVHNVTQDDRYVKIGSAITYANNDDVIVVEPGVYNENIDFLGKSLEITSTDPNSWDVVAATIIDGGSNGSVVTFASGETTSSIFEGFTVTGGNAVVGGGIYCTGSSSNPTTPTIRKCIIEDNTATMFGGGIYAFGLYGKLEVDNCKISGNSAENGGGVAVSTSCAIELTNCILDGNQADNGGGGYNAGYSGLIFKNCTVVNNTASVDGGGAGGSGSYGSISVNDSIVWGNTAGAGDNQISRVYMTFVAYSDVQDCGGSGEGWDISLGIDQGGNIDTDPLFVDAANGDYHLLTESPCADTGNPIGDYSGQTDIDNGSRVVRGIVDMGADEISRVHNVTQDTWYEHIQDAIDATLTSDVIVVSEDIYYENLDFLGKSITVTSTDPDDWDVVAATIIDGGGNGTVVTFASGETAAAVLEGFTIQNGTGTIWATGPQTHGGGIRISRTSDYLQASTPTIRKCIVENNSATTGGGIYAVGTWKLRGTAMAISDCILRNNTATDGGGFFAGAYAIYDLNNCLIYGNTANEDGGGVLQGNYSILYLNNCTIAGNTAETYGGGVHRPISSTCNTYITNTILWGNTAGTGSDQLYGSGNYLAVSYSDVEGGYAGTGNIDSDPLFGDAANGDYYLASTSQCIDAADGDAAPMADIDGNARYDDPSTSNTGVGTPDYVDIGASEYQGS